jgi:hypothetical protein
MQPVVLVATAAVHNALRSDDPVGIAPGLTAGSLGVALAAGTWTGDLRHCLDRGGIPSLVIPSHLRTKTAEQMDRTQ